MLSIRYENIGISRDGNPSLMFAMFCLLQFAYCLHIIPYPFSNSTELVLVHFIVLFFFFFIIIYVSETLDPYRRIYCVFSSSFLSCATKSYVENVYTIRYKSFDRSIEQLNMIFLRFCLLCITRTYRIMYVCTSCVYVLHMLYTYCTWLYSYV